MKGNKGRSTLVLLGRTKLGLPAVLLFYSLFFLAGFIGSMLLSHDISVGGAPQMRLLEELEEEGEWVAMAYGETGESMISSILFQVQRLKRKILGTYFQALKTPYGC